ncbi:MAG: hypothetical protein ACYC5O_13740 [Anaerolineae bacterium]
MSEYYARCSARFPALAAVVSRGPLADVLPGLSDVDLRLLCDDVGPDDWGPLDEAVLAVHGELAGRGPEAARLLQHPPGACFLLTELSDPRLLHPEARLWQWCDGTAAAHDVVAGLAGGWSERDEVYHLRRYLAACGDWSADPSGTTAGHNCGCRGALVHFLLLALEAALSLEAGRVQPGRLRALATFREREPGNPVLAQVDAAVTGDEHGDAADCRALRESARAFLIGLAPRLAQALGREQGALPAPNWLRQRAARQQSGPLLTLYDAVRFSRVRRAHFRFFLQAGGEADWLVANELATLRGLLLQPALTAYGSLRWGPVAAAPRLALTRLTGELSAAESDAIARLLMLSEATSAARAALAEAADLYPTYQRVLERLLHDARTRGRRASGGR